MGRDATLWPQSKSGEAGATVPAHDWRWISTARSVGDIVASAPGQRADSLPRPSPRYAGSTGARDMPAANQHLTGWRCAPSGASFIQRSGRGASRPIWRRPRSGSTAAAIDMHTSGPCCLPRGGPRTQGRGGAWSRPRRNLWSPTLAENGRNEHEDP